MTREVTRTIQIFRVVSLSFVFIVLLALSAFEEVKGASQLLRLSPKLPGVNGGLAARSRSINSSCAVTSRASLERSFYGLNPQTRLLLGPPIEVIATKLEACRQGRIKSLVINLPPRHLKSHCASIAFVAWFLGHHPAWNIICASYGQDLSDKLARDCRNIMMSAWYKQLFPTRLADRIAVHDFMTTDLGTRLSTSVGGVLTGRGADLIIIDDALKPDEA